MRLGRAIIAMAMLVAATAGAGTLAIFRTTLGEVVVELFDQHKPKTVRNFIALTRSGAYSNSLIHRCEPGFVAQGGGFAVTNPTADVLANAVDFLDVPDFGPITNEFAVGPLCSNGYGTIAMAKVPGDTNSATSQYFFNLADNSAHLDNIEGGFTVFGRIIAGTNVLDQFNFRYTWYGIVDYRLFYGVTNNWTSIFKSVPVTFAGVDVPKYFELIYAGVEIQDVALDMTPTGRVIRWNAPSGLVQRVEYATGVDQTVWDTLVITTGVSGIMTAVDTSTPVRARMYRVTTPIP